MIWSTVFISNQFPNFCSDCDGGGDGVRRGVRVQPLVQQAVHDVLQHHLHRPAGAGVRGELQEELLHPVQPHRLPGQGANLQVSTWLHAWLSQPFTQFIPCVDFSAS